MKMADCGCIIDDNRSVLATCWNHGMQLSLRGIQWTQPTPPQYPITVLPLTVGPVGCCCGTSVAGQHCPIHGSNICQS